MKFDNVKLDKEMMERLRKNGIYLSDCSKVTREQALVFIGEVMLKRFVKDFSELWEEELFPDCRLTDYEATEEDWRTWLGDDYRENNSKDTVDDRKADKQEEQTNSLSSLNKCKGVKKMESTIREKIDAYVEIFDAIRDKTESEEAAIVILQEMNKDRRSVEIREEREAKHEDAATTRQRGFMKTLGIRCPATVTRKEASLLIDEELTKLNGH